MTEHTERLSSQDGALKLVLRAAPMSPDRFRKLPSWMKGHLENLVTHLQERDDLIAMLSEKITEEPCDTGVAPGRFRWDLKACFEYNAAEREYRVVVWEWRESRSSKGDGHDMGWQPSWPYDDGFQHVRDFPARRYNAAVRYYAKVMARRAELHVRNTKADQVADGWARLA